MNRPWLISVVFVLCLAVLLAAMGWTSLTVLRLDRAEELARQQSELEANARLALWRIDSALSPLIAQESGRPYFAYGSFYPAERAYTCMFNETRKGELLLPSPLLKDPTPHILLHFQFGPDGKVSSPQVPTGNRLGLAQSVCAKTDQVQVSANRLADLQGHLNVADLLKLLPEQSAVSQPQPVLAARQGIDSNENAGNLSANTRNGPPSQSANSQQEAQQGAIAGYQTTNNPYNNAERQQQLRSAEWNKRTQAYQNWDNVNRSINDADAIFMFENAALPSGINEGLMKPLWFGDRLVLARRVLVNGHTYVQGCWLDWPEMKSWVLGEVRDLLPNADLEAVKGDSDEGGFRLAALPAKLVPGAPPLEAAATGLSPVRLSLCVAWMCILVAAAAVAALLIGAVSLSERRGAFVSAVTHELRTPLTTFRMYTEMLSEDMVAPEKRHTYLQTLRTEAERLSHLVENVLAYARLERIDTKRRLETVNVAGFLEHAGSRLFQRANLCGMELSVDATDKTALARMDASAAEQILFNLVDNACKYALATKNGQAGNPGCKKIEISVAAGQKSTTIRVRDYGPGISSSDRRRLFRPFSKSAHEAANSVQGVGLGLALSRRLARQMGGDLRVDEKIKDGACFVLTLPRGNN